MPQAVLEGLEVETGGEDLPDAFRWVPNAEEDNDVNIHGMHHEERGQWVYQVVYGMVFGKAVSVVAFYRLHRLLQSLGRRWLMLLLSLYFDDATIQDLTTARGRGQLHLNELSELLGFPFATEKHVPLGPSADFLGLTHDVKMAFKTGVIHFKPKARSEEKIDKVIEAVFDAEECWPGVASKIRGMTGFTCQVSMARWAEAANMHCCRGSTGTENLGH